MSRVISIEVERCVECCYYEEEEYEYPNSKPETFYCCNLGKDVRVDSIDETGFPKCCPGKVAICSIHKNGETEEEAVSRWRRNEQ